MIRDIDRLKSETFDILVIGGGIHGTTVLWEAARRGYKSAIIDQGDFGHATSANSLKIIHGGLRYLQHANFKRMRQSIRSRKIFQLIAPHLLKPVPFIIPTYGHGIKSKPMMAVALFLNDLISADRNRGIIQDCHIPNGKILSKEELLKILPWIDQSKLTGGAHWFESVAYNTERLTLEFILDAFEFGAVAANYIKAEEIKIEGDQLTYVTVKDGLANTDFKIKARQIVFAVGPWFNNQKTLLPEFETKEINLVKAVNIIVKRNLFNKNAVGLETSRHFEDKEAIIKRGKRLYFFVPWGNYTMIGTTYHHYSGDLQQLKIDHDDIREIIDEVNTIYPKLELKFSDVSFFHHGLLPAMAKSPEGDDDAQPESHSLIVKSLPENSVYSIKSVKYTTAPDLAKKMLDIISGKLSPGDNKARNKENIFIKENSLDEITKIVGSPDLAAHLYDNFGIRGKKIAELLEKDRSSRKQLMTEPPVSVAEILYVVREEMAQTLADVVFRRIGLGSAEMPDRDALFAIAKIVAVELNWRYEKIEEEVNSVLAVYAPLKLDAMQRYN